LVSQLLQPVSKHSESDFSSLIFCPLVLAAEILAPLKQAPLNSLAVVLSVCRHCYWCCNHCTAVVGGGTGVLLLVLRCSPPSDPDCWGPLLFARSFVARVNHRIQNLQTWLKTLAIDLTTAITASATCNNGMELVSNTNVQPRSIARRHDNRLADCGNSERYLQQWHGTALEETMSNLAGIARRHSR
jgi:hypothetical protein